MSIKGIVYEIIRKITGKKDKNQMQLEEPVENNEIDNSLINEDKIESQVDENKMEPQVNEIENNEEEIIEEDTLVSRYLSIIRTRIYLDKIDDDFIDEINESEILSQYQKTIILLALCEKNNMLKRAKQIKDNSNFKNENERKEINKIIERIKSNKIKNFDLKRYDSVLGWEYNEELYESYLKQEEEEEEKSLENTIKVSKEIKQLINDERYEEAEKKGKKYKDNIIIQTQMLLIAIKQNDFEKIKLIAKTYKDFEAIQIQIGNYIKELISLEEFEKAIELCEFFLENPIIQSQRLTIAIKQNDFGKIQQIAKTYKDVKAIQRQISILINELIDNRKYKTATQLGEIFKDDSIIQSQMLTIAIIQKDYEKIEQIAIIYKDVKAIQRQISVLINELIESSEYKTAIRLGKIFKDDVIMQSQMLLIAIKTEDNNEIKQIAKKYKDDEVIRTQLERYIEIQLIKKQYAIVLEIQDILNNKEKTQEQLQPENSESIEDVENSENIEDNEKNHYLAKLKTRIYLGKIDDELINEINESQILSEYERTIILFAIYEKKNMPERVKQIQAKANFEDESQKREVRKIIERMKSKKKRIFDFGIYDKLLYWQFDEELLGKYKNNEDDKQAVKESSEISKPVDKEGKIENTEEIILEQEGNKDGLEISTENADTNNLKIEDNTDNIVKKQNSSVKAIVLEYLIEKRVDIYVKTFTDNINKRKKAINQLDIIQEMIERVENCKNDDEYIDMLYNRIQKLKNSENNNKEVEDRDE